MNKRSFALMFALFASVGETKFIRNRTRIENRGNVDGNEGAALNKRYRKSERNLYHVARGGYNQ